MHAVAVAEPGLQAQRRHTLSHAWWAAAVVSVGLLFVDVAGHLAHGAPRTTVWALSVSVTASWFAAALWIWGWRTRRMGLIIYGTAVGNLLADLQVAYPDSRLAWTLGLLGLNVIGAGFFVWWWLAYPTGRLEDNLTRVVVVINWVWGVMMIPALLFYDNPPSYFYVGHTVSWLDSWNWWSTLAVIAVAEPVLKFMLVRRFIRASPGARRTIGPLFIAVLIQSISFWWFCYSILASSASFYSNILESYIGAIGGWGMALTTIGGLLTTRRARGVVGDLVVDLGRVGPGGYGTPWCARSAIRRSSWRFGYPRQNGWVDEQGRDVRASPEGPDRAVTLVGDQLAAIIHDPVLLDQPALLEAAGSAAHFALENERLQAELRAPLAELRESRARIVRAGDEERRRLERDLHDGAQQRLLALGMALQLLRSHVTDRQGGVLLRETEGELQEALADLRELARGIHPAVLTDQGLGTAIRTLAGRAPVPVEVSACGERLPAHMETAAYFVVAESLANIAKYAQASKARIGVERAEGLVRIAGRRRRCGGRQPV